MKLPSTKRRNWKENKEKQKLCPGLADECKAKERGHGQGADGDYEAQSGRRVTGSGAKRKGRAANGSRGRRAGVRVCHDVDIAGATLHNR